MENMILDNLKRIAKALSVQFGEHCEIVIHDLTGNAIEHSIVHIENGDISGRSVGDGPSQLVLDAFAKKTDSDLPDHLAYLLHSVNIFICRLTEAMHIHHITATLAFEGDEVVLNVHDDELEVAVLCLIFIR